MPIDASGAQTGVFDPLTATFDHTAEVPGVE
jgi:hypothetical protein